jgi:hypothetical protein
MCMCVCVCDLQNGLGRRPPASAAGPAPAEWQSGPQARRPHPGAVFRQQGNRQPFSPQATVPRRRPPVRSAAGLFCFVCVLGTISRAGVFVSSHLAVLTGFVWVCLCTDGCGGIESGGGGTEGTAGDAACVDLFWWTHVLACLFVWCRGVVVLLFWNPTLTYRISRVVFVQATAVQRQRRQLRRLRPPCVPRAVVFFNGCNAGSERFGKRLRDHRFVWLSEQTCVHAAMRNLHLHCRRAGKALRALLNLLSLQHLSCLLAIIAKWVS